MQGKRYLPVGILFCVIVVIQLLTTLFHVEYFLTQLTMSAYYTLTALGLCMLMGYTGQISLGQAGFFALGGYVSASLTTLDFSPLRDKGIVLFFERISFLQTADNIYGDEILFLNPWIAFAAAVLLTAGIAFVIGIPVLKLKGHYLAMATLGFSIIIYRIVLGTRFLGEADGISSVPSFRLLPGLHVNGDFSARAGNFYIAWVIVIIGLVLLLNLINSRAGRALRYIHGNEKAAGAMGVNTARYKLTVFIISALFASIGGFFLTHYNGGIGPSEAGVMKSVRYVAIVAVGGMANLWGTLIMGTLLNFLSLRGVFGSFDDAVFGGILIIIMIFAPEGIIRPALFRFLMDKVRKRRRAGASS